MNTQYDIAIIGGGPVGAALALALRDSKLNTAHWRRAPQMPPALACAPSLCLMARLLLARLGVWDALHEVSAIRTIYISQ